MRLLGESGISAANALMMMMAVALLPMMAHSKDPEIITEPKPGQEYVKIQASNKQHSIKESKSVVMSVSSSKSSSFRPARSSHLDSTQRQYHHDHHLAYAKPQIYHPHRIDPAVHVTEEARIGVYKPHPDTIEKSILDAKADQRLSSKKDQYLQKKDSRLTKEVEVRDSGNLGVKRPQVYLGPGDLGLPAQKNLHPEPTASTFSHYKKDVLTKRSDQFEVIGVSSTKSKRPDEGAFDFIDSPLSDKVLTPAGSSQASRINVKKGPNGQDYEYEYVYYYYDDDEESPADKGKEAKDSEAKKPELTQTPSSVQHSGRFVTPSSEVEDKRDSHQVHLDKKSEVTHAAILEQAEQLPHHHPHLATHTLTHQPISPQVNEDRYPEVDTVSPHQRQQYSHDDQPRRDQPRNRQPIDQDGEYGTSRGRTDHRQQPQQFERQPQQIDRQPQQIDRQPQQFERQPQQFERQPQQIERQPQQIERQPQQYERQPQYQDSSRSTADHRGRHPEPAETDEFSSGRGRSRYQSVERPRGSDPVSVTTQEPVQNEIIPSRSHHRGRGRGQTSTPVVEDSSEERGQRFQSRTRQQEKPTTVRSKPAQHVRRPSLELVDSSSFRTHSSDLPPHQDIPTEYSQLPTRGGGGSRVRGYAEDTRESDLPEYIDEVSDPSRQSQPGARAPAVTAPARTPQPAVSTIRYQELEADLNQPSPGVFGLDVNQQVVSRPVQPAEEPSRTQAPQYLPEAPIELTMPEKAALDLYALLQSHEAQHGANEVEPQTTEEIATEPPTTTTTTVKTTTTTQPAPTQRGRFRGNTRTRTRTTQQPQTTEASAQEPKTRGRFQPSRSPSTGGGSLSGNFGGRTRSGFKQTTPSPPSSEEEVRSEVTQRARPSFSANRFRTRARPGQSSTAAQQPTTEQEPVETTVRPSRPRINPAVRPLRPGPRINLSGARPQPVNTPRPEQQQPQERPQHVDEDRERERDSSGQNGESGVDVTTDSALTRLRNRPRLRISASSPARSAGGSPPLSAAPRRPLPHGLAGRRRPSDVEPSEEPAQEEDEAPEQPLPEPEEEIHQPSPAPTHESRLNSLIKRRRPLPGSLHRPQPHNQDN